VKVSQEWTLEGRLFQIAGGAKQKPRAPNEMLTDRRLAEADLHEMCHWTKLAKYGGGVSWQRLVSYILFQAICY